MVQSGSVPKQSTAFPAAVRKELVPMHIVHQRHNMLGRLIQKPRTSPYMNEFSNTAIGLPGISEDEKLDKYCSDLRPMVHLEELKSGPEILDSTTQIALNADSSLYGAGMLNSGHGPAFRSAPEPKDNGNVETRPHYPGEGRGKKQMLLKNMVRIQKKWQIMLVLYTLKNAVLLGKKNEQGP